MLRVALVGFALVAAAGAGWLAFTRFSSPPPDPEIVDALATAEILIASVDIARGAALGPGNVGWTEWPEEAIAPDMVKRAGAPNAIDTYTGWISRHDLAAGHPVQVGRIAESTAGLMALALTPGMRAVAVEISAETGAGGFILPHDRVDVVHTVQEDIDADGEDEPVSLTIMENVRVLAIDQTAEPEQGETAKVGDTVTLELTPLQVELLTTARNSGRISLALRAVSDFGEVATGDLALMPGLPLMMGSAAETPFAATVETLEPEVGEAEVVVVENEGSDEAPLAENDDLEAVAEAQEVEVRLIGSGTLETFYVEPAR